MTDHANISEAGEIAQPAPRAGDAWEAARENVEKPAVNYEALSFHETMLKEIRTWGYWQLGLGVIHVVASGFLNAPWGVLLILVGLASFYFRTASMFVIYAVTFIWAGISNLLSFSSGVVFLALFQFFFSVRIFSQFRRFRNAERAALQISDREDIKTAVQRANRIFPWSGPLFGCSSVLGMILTFLIVFAIGVASEGTAETPGYFVFIDGLLINLGVLGFAVGLASLLAKYRLKGLAILGMVSGALSLAIVLAFFLLGKISQ